MYKVVLLVGDQHCNVAVAPFSTVNGVNLPSVGGQRQFTTTVTTYWHRATDGVPQDLLLTLSVDLPAATNHMGADSSEVSTALQWCAAPDGSAYPQLPSSIDATKKAFKWRIHVGE